MRVIAVQDNTRWHPVQEIMFGVSDFAASYALLYLNVVGVDVWSFMAVATGDKRAMNNGRDMNA